MLSTRPLWPRAADGLEFQKRVCSTSVLPTTKRLSENHQEHEGGCNENARDEKEGS